tara:strand:- start:239 stop:706 length:468 start_codon:yes stop_codon:yes gene_type:complete
MAHFAKLGIDNEVIQILYMDTILTMTNGGIEDENIGIAYLKEHHGHENWKRCSYNTKRGIHRAGGTPFRGSYPKLGWFYDSTLDKFVEPRPLDKDGDPCNSWTFNTSTVHYDPPITKPTLTEEQNAASKCWLWDESAYQSDNNQGWFLINQSSEE